MPELSDLKARAREDGTLPVLKPIGTEELLAKADVGAVVPLPPPVPEIAVPLYVVRAAGGWLNLAAYARFIEDGEYDRLLLFRGTEADPLPLTGADASRVRKHLRRLEER